MLLKPSISDRGGKIPPIRLEGFSGEWFEQTAGDILQSPLTLRQ